MPRKTFDPESKTWKGADLTSIYNPALNLGYIILSLFKNSPQQIHQINADTDARTNNHEMYWRVVRIAVHLRELGYQKGDTVQVLAGNSEYISALTIACFTLGMPISFLRPSFGTKVNADLLGIVKPKLIFCDSNLMGLLKEALDETKMTVPIFTLMEKIEGHGFLEDFLIESKDEIDFVAPNLRDVSQLPACIAFTSGSTGPQKGIVYTHTALLEMFAPAK
jgi:acyl-coenzyme A synthetase/AMP-(fatty) acid ligase